MTYGDQWADCLYTGISSGLGIKYGKPLPFLPSNIFQIWLANAYSFMSPFSQFFWGFDPLNVKVNQADPQTASMVAGNVV